MVSLQSLFGDEGSILAERNYQLILLANIMGPLGTALLSPILDSLIGPFGTSPAQIGLMISVFVAPAIVVIPMAGILADRFGRKPIIVSGLVLFGTAGAAVALTTNFQVALGLRVIQGIGAAGLIPIIVTSIGDLYDGDREATAQGIRFTGSGVTQATFPLASGLLVGVAWQYPFFLYLIAIPIAVAIYLWFDEPTNFNRSDSDPTSPRDSAWSQLTALGRLMANRRVYMLVIARSLPEIVWFGFLTYNSIVVVRLIGGTPAQAGVLVLFGSLSYATAASQAGRITAMFTSRYYPLIGANIALGLGYAVFVLSPVLVVAGVGIMVAGVGLGLTMTLYRSIITGYATESLRGGIVSVSEAGGRIAATMTPIMMGATIAIGSPVIGFGPSVQLAGIGVAVLAGVGGTLCLLVVHTAPPITHPT